jgi:hypothetical protein
MKSIASRAALPAVCVLLAGSSAALATGPVAHAAGPARGSGATGATATAPPGARPGAFSMTISPPRLDVARADVNTTQHVQVVNGGRSPLTVTVRKRNFSGAPDGTMDFHASAPYSASNWVAVSPTRFVVAPGATRTVNVTIAIPAAAEPGDHQVGLVFSVPTTQATANIRVNRAIAIPAYITVPGPITNAVSLGDVHARGFTAGGPVTIFATVHNTGTVHREFPANARLTFSGAGTAAAFPGFTVMRESTRDVSTSWDPPLICICHPKLSIVGSDGAVHSTSVRIIVVPVVPLAIVLGGLLALWFAVRLTRRRYRSSVVRAAARLIDPTST